MGRELDKRLVALLVHDLHSDNVAAGSEEAEERLRDGALHHVLDVHAAPGVLVHHLRVAGVSVHHGGSVRAGSTVVRVAMAVAMRAVSVPVVGSVSVVRAVSVVGSVSMVGSVVGAMVGAVVVVGPVVVRGAVVVVRSVVVCRWAVLGVSVVRGVRAMVGTVVGTMVGSVVVVGGSVSWGAMVVSRGAVGVVHVVHAAGPVLLADRGAHAHTGVVDEVKPIADLLDLDARLVGVAETHCGRTHGLAAHLLAHDLRRVVAVHLDKPLHDAFLAGPELDALHLASLGAHEVCQLAAVGLAVSEAGDAEDENLVHLLICNVRVAGRELSLELLSLQGRLAEVVHQGNCLGVGRHLDERMTRLLLHETTLHGADLVRVVHNVLNLNVIGHALHQHNTALRLVHLILDLLRLRVLPVVQLSHLVKWYI